MKNRIALIGIILDNTKAVNQMNEILHKYKSAIIGRMGIPHGNKHIISIAMDTTEDEISALSGKLGMLEGVTTKTIYEPK